MLPSSSRPANDALYASPALLTQPNEHRPRHALHLPHLVHFRRRRLVEQQIVLPPFLTSDAAALALLHQLPTPVTKVHAAATRNVRAPRRALDDGAASRAALPAAGLPEEERLLQPVVDLAALRVVPVPRPATARAGLRAARGARLREGVGAVAAGRGIWRAASRPEEARARGVGAVEPVCGGELVRFLLHHRVDVGGDVRADEGERDGELAAERGEDLAGEVREEHVEHAAGVVGVRACEGDDGAAAEDVDGVAARDALG